MQLRENLASQPAETEGLHARVVDQNRSPTLGLAVHSPQQGRADGSAATRLNVGQTTPIGNAIDDATRNRLPDEAVAQRQLWDQRRTLHPLQPLLKRLGS